MQPPRDTLMQCCYADALSICTRIIHGIDLGSHREAVDQACRWDGQVVANRELAETAR